MSKEEEIMNLNPASIMKKFTDKVGLKGTLLSTAGATVGLELGTQFIENHSPQSVKNILDYKITDSAPFLGRTDVRDAIVLSPSIGQSLKLLKGAGRPNFKVIAINYGGKVLMRMAGINPLPDKHKPAQNVKKAFSYQLPARQ